MSLTKSLTFHNQNEEMGTNTMYTMYTWNEEPLCWNWAPEPNYTTLMYACEVLKHCSNVKSNVVVFKITSQTEKVMPTNKTNNFFANKSKYDINDNWWDFPISIGTINNSDWLSPKLRVNWGNQINFDFGPCRVRVSAEPTMWPFYSA